MKAGIVAAVALAGMLASGGAMADGNELLTRCQSMVQYFDSNGVEGDALSAGLCVGVIIGVTSLRTITNPSFPKEYQTCFPSPVPPNIQAGRIAVKYMKEHPENLNMDDGVIMLMALQRAFPCKK